MLGEYLAEYFNCEGRLHIMQRYFRYVFSHFVSRHRVKLLLYIIMLTIEKIRIEIKHVAIIKNGVIIIKLFLKLFALSPVPCSQHHHHNHHHHRYRQPRRSRKIKSSTNCK